MKKVFQLLLASCFLLGVLKIANTQQIIPGDSVYVPSTQLPSKIEESPRETLNQFIMLCNDYSLRNIADYVDGADRDNADWEIVSEAIAYDFKLLQLSFTDFKVTHNAADKDIYHTEFKLILKDRIFKFGMANIEHLTMKRHVGKEGGEYWQIIPQKLIYNPRQEPFAFGDGGVIEQLVSMAAYPKAALPALNIQFSISKLKQIGLTLAMYTQDHNDKIDLTPQNYVQKLMPYVMKRESLFTAKEDAPGTISFQINSNLSGLKTTDIRILAKTVAFYLGHDQKLDFRYGGLSPVCFMDGHVKAVSPEEAKDLRWKP
jgi:prepilin-type processing-associated H-X9-DG protein